MNPMPHAAMAALLLSTAVVAAEPVAPPPIFVPPPVPAKVTPVPVKPKPKVPGPGLFELAPDGRTLYFAGTIANASYDRLKQLLDANPGVRRLDVASSGGLVLSARLMGALVIRRKLAVHVEHSCASACTLILLASSERTMGPSARIGFHQSYELHPRKRLRGGQSKTSKGIDAKNGGDSSAEATETPSAAVNMGDTFSRRSLANAGVDDAFIERALTTSSEDMWYPDADQLLSAKVVTAQIPEPRPQGPSWGISRTAVIQSLPDPMWSTLRDHDPALWGEAVDAIWHDRNGGASEDAAMETPRSQVIEQLLPMLVRAPDEMAARLATIHAEQSRIAAMDASGFCRPDPFVERVISGDERAQNRLEDAALADLMRLARWQKPMSARKAEKVFARFLRDNQVLSDSLLEGDDAESDCRNGLELLQAIGSAPLDRRGAIYRALMALD